VLDIVTKRRIDSARDTLVGKVPDPKSQVEQITIALIYKFMDDMDAEAEEFGGKRQFFAGEFAKYGWAQLMNPRIGGHERLGLYAEGISRMVENPGIPSLFRDMFKNAYLPYRDPETLTAFLKIINDFTYDHSERLGDAFEYLLSVLGSQGDAGQFRTPRHIIDFMVEVMAPQKGDVILDPACGTAGFLISAYKHIRRANSDDAGQSTLTPDEKERLAANFKGYDISPDMVRLSLVNMYLHGFSDPHIFEYDTLTSEERWGEHANVILANPPFMSPKGGIRPHKRFSIQAKRSEVLFVDYIAEHLTPNGRAAIVVPEGIVSLTQGAYCALRKLLVEESLVAVVSLPSGSFQPYSGVKTSILILDKAIARRTDSVAFFKVTNDGFELGAQRRPIDKDDLPGVLADVTAHLGRLRRGEPSSDLGLVNGFIVPKVRIAADGQYSLKAERYRAGNQVSTAFDLVPASRFMKRSVPTIDPRNSPDEQFDLYSIPAYDSRKPEVILGSQIGSQKKCVNPGDVLLSRIVPHIRRVWVVGKREEGRRQIASTEWLVFSGEEVHPGFLQRILLSDPFHARFMQTVSGVGGSLSRANPDAVGDIQIPLPPLSVQQQIMTAIDECEVEISQLEGAVSEVRARIRETLGTIWGEASDDAV